MADLERLDLTGCEYFTWPVSLLDEDNGPVPLTTVEVAFPTQRSLATATWEEASVSDGKIRVLLQGPLSTVETATTLAAGWNYPAFRAVDNPEKIPVYGIPIHVS